MNKWLSEVEKKLKKVEEEAKKRIETQNKEALRKYCEAYSNPNHVLKKIKQVQSTLHTLNFVSVGLSLVAAYLLGITWYALSIVFLGVAALFLLISRRVYTYEVALWHVYFLGEKKRIEDAKGKS